MTEIGERKVLCVRLRYTDCAWIHDLKDAGWDVRLAGDLATAHRLLEGQGFLVGLLVPGKIDEAGCVELDAWLCSHGSLEWVGVFEPGLASTPGCRDIIVEHLFDHHTPPVDVARLTMTLVQCFVLFGT